MCDTYDALTNARSYKAAWTHVGALATIAADSGHAFDPAVVRAFLALWNDTALDAVDDHDVRFGQQWTS